VNISCDSKLGHNERVARDDFVVKEFSEVGIRTAVPKNVPFIQRLPHSLLIQMHPVQQLLYEPKYYVAIQINRFSPKDYEHQQEKSLLFGNNEFGRWHYDHHLTLESRTEKDWRTIRVDKEAPNGDFLAVDASLYLPVLTDAELEKVNRIIESIAPLK